MNDLAVTPAPIPTGALERRTYLGGGDIAQLLGVSPWGTPLGLFLKKVQGEVPIDAEKKKFFARRKRQEPVIAEMLADEYGIVVTRLSLDADQNRYIDQDYPFLAAEIDFEFRMSGEVREKFPGRPDFAAIPDGTLLNGEIKTVHPFAASKWGEQGSEDLPIEYACQVMHGLGVTRRPAAIVAALFGLDILLCFPVIADQDTIKAMREQSVRFWTAHVVTQIPPDPINVEDVTKLYAGFEGKPVALSDEAYEALRNLDIARGNVRAIENEQAELEWRIARCVAFQWGVELTETKSEKPVIASTENALLMYGGTKVGTWNRQSRSSIDVKRLRDEKPEIARDYSTESQFRVFRLKKEQ